MFDLKKYSNTLQIKKINQIIKCNEITSNYGIILSEDDAKQLTTIQQNTLQEVGLIEFDSHIIEYIIITFCDSSFINKYDYLDTISRLVEIFYYYRQEVNELISDEDIIKYLYLAYEGITQGSLDYLGDQQLSKLIDDLNNHLDIFDELEYGN